MATSPIVILPLPVTSPRTDILYLIVSELSAIDISSPVLIVLVLLILFSLEFLIVMVPLVSILFNISEYVVFIANTF